jgi:hypothetical protein
VRGAPMTQTPRPDEPLDPFLSRHEIGRLLAETAARNLAHTGRHPQAPDTLTPRSS